MNESDRQSTVFVVEDDEAMRDSIQWLLESANLGSSMFGCAFDFLESCNPEQEGCLLLDVRMPDMSGMELLEELKPRGITLPVIIITGHGDVPMAVRALKHGAFDFVQKPFNAEELLDRVYTALRLDQENRQRSSETNQRRAHYAILTDREKEVAGLIAAGNSSKLVAIQLGISPKTVDIHRANIMRKLNVRTIAEIIQIRLSL